MAELGGDAALLQRNQAAVQNYDLSMASTETTDRSEGRARLSSFNGSQQTGAGQPSSKLNALTENAYKLDCYSFGIVLWVLLGWELPFRDTPPLQILLAVGYLNKRPSTKAIVTKGWSTPVVDLMRSLWSADPRDRPTIRETKEQLATYSSKLSAAAKYM